MPEVRLAKHSWVDDLRQTIEDRLDVLEEFGTKQGEVVVASASAAQAFRDRADFLCDGSGDEVEINAALVAAGEGGSVTLVGGPDGFSVGGEITIPADYIRLRGAGPLTRIVRETNVGGSGVVAIGREGVIVSDLFLDMNRDGQPDDHSAGGGRGFHLEDSNFVYIDRCTVFEALSHGWEVTNVSGLRVRDCVAEYCWGSGYRLTSVNNGLLGEIEALFIEDGGIANVHGVSIRDGCSHVLINSLVTESCTERGGVNIAGTPAPESIAVIGHSSTDDQRSLTLGGGRNVLYTGLVSNNATATAMFIDDAENALISDFAIYSRGFGAVGIRPGPSTDVNIGPGVVDTDGEAIELPSGVKERLAIRGVRATSTELQGYKATGPQAGSTIVLEGCYFYSEDSEPVWIQNQDSGEHTILDCTMETVGRRVIIEADQTYISNCTIKSGTTICLELRTGTTRTRIENCRFDGPGDGIRINTGVANTVIDGCYSVTNGWGVRALGSNADPIADLRMINCDWLECSSGGINFGNDQRVDRLSIENNRMHNWIEPDATELVVRNNYGVRTENHGQEIGVSQSAVVSHGLDRTPDPGGIMVTMVNPPSTSGNTKFWVNGVTSSTFTINTNRSAAIDFNWSAKAWYEQP